MELICILLALFGIKHFICDFVLQTNSIVKDKGTYGALGGIVHAVHHAIGTAIVIAIVFGDLLSAAMLGWIDGVLHYHIDWVKTNLSRGLTVADQKYWVLFGADQGLHYLTYVGIIAIVTLL